MTEKESLILQIEKCWSNIAKACSDRDKNAYWAFSQEYQALHNQYYWETGEEYDHREE